MKDICSYCQREYGILSINNKPIYKTFDYIKPRLLSNKDRKGNGRAGMMCKGATLKEEEINNLLQCCNECNYIKKDMSLMQFNSKIDYMFYKRKNIKIYRFLTKDIVKNIKNAINILIKNKSEFIYIEIYQFELII